MLDLSLSSPVARERDFRSEVEMKITLVVESLSGKKVRIFRVFISNGNLIRSPSRKLMGSSLVRFCLPCPTGYSVLKLGWISDLGSQLCVV